MPSQRPQSPRDLATELPGNSRTAARRRRTLLARSVGLVVGLVAAGGVYLAMAPQQGLLTSGGAITSSAAAVPPLQADPGRFSAQNVGAAWSFEQTNGVNRYEVRSGDHMAGDGSEPKERSEAYNPFKLDAGKMYKVSYKLMIEPGAPNSAKWLLLNQLQSTFDKGENGHSPPFAIGLKGEHLQIDSRSSPAQLSTPADTSYVQLYNDPNPIQRGHWYQFDIFVKFDPFGDGSVRVVRDGVQIVDYKGAIGFNDTVGAYFKEGVYRGAAPETTAAQFKDFSITRVGA